MQKAAEIVLIEEPLLTGNPGSSQQRDSLGWDSGLQYCRSSCATTIPMKTLWTFPI